MSGLAGCYSPGWAPIGPDLERRMQKSLCGYDRVEVCSKEAGAWVALGENTGSHLKASFARKHGLWVAFAGRLDNGGELQRRFGRANESAAELVLEGYLAWGDAAWARLHGDWNAVLFHGADRSLRLVSDYAALRPLCYAQVGGAVCWAPDAEVLQQVTPHGATLDLTWATAYLADVPYAGASQYRDVAMVAPGHCVHVTQTGLRQNRYWQLQPGNRIVYQNDTDYAERLKELVEEAVAVRTRGCRTTFAELSGGLDSSTVCCEAARQGVRLRTVSYLEAGSTDQSYIQCVQEQYRLPHVRVALEERTADWNSFQGQEVPHLWNEVYAGVAQEMKRHESHVLLNGQNGDLVFGNYWDDVEQTAELLVQGRVGDFSRELLRWSATCRMPVYGLGWRACRAALGLRSGDRSSTLLERRHADAAADLEARYRRHSVFAEAPVSRRHHYQAQARLIDSRAFRTPAALREASYASPFLDRRLVEFMLAIPAHVVNRPGEPRRLMRRAFAALWPQELRKRRSKAAYGRSMVEALRPLALRCSEESGSQLAMAGLVRDGEFREGLRRFANGLPVREPRFMRFLLLELVLSARQRNKIPDFSDAADTRSAHVSGQATGARWDPGAK